MAEAQVKTAMDLLESVDKPMMLSKKFTGFLLIEISWKVVLVYAIWKGLSDTVLLAIIGGTTAAETAFQSWQAWHDKHIKSKKLDAMNGKASTENLIREASEIAASAEPKS